MRVGRGRGWRAEEKTRGMARQRDEGSEGGPDGRGARGRETRGRAVDETWAMARRGRGRGGEEGRRDNEGRDDGRGRGEAARARQDSETREQADERTRACPSTSNGLQQREGTCRRRPLLLLLVPLLMLMLVPLMLVPPSLVPPLPLAAAAAYFHRGLASELGT